MRKLAVLAVLLMFVVVQAEAAEIKRKTPDSNPAAMRYYLDILSVFRQHFDSIFIREFAGEWQREIVLGRFEGKPVLRIRLKNIKKAGESASLITTVPREDEMEDAVAGVISELRRLINMKMIIF